MQLKLITVFICLFLMLVITNRNTLAQEVRKPQTVTIEEEDTTVRVNYGIEFYSRYLWRGVDLSRSPSLVPAIDVSFGGFGVSLEGAYGFFEKVYKHPDFTDLDSLSVPNDLYLEKIALNRVSMGIFYKFKMDAGTFTIRATDYYFPDRLVKSIKSDSAGNENVSYVKTKWTNWKDSEEGAHTIETSVRFTGNKNFPLWVFLALNVYNDPQYPVYAETGYTFNILKNSFSLFAGGVVGGSKWYEFNFREGEVHGDLGLINLGLDFHREVPLNDWITLNISVADILNLYQEKNTIIFKAQLMVE